MGTPPSANVTTPSGDELLHTVICGDGPDTLVFLPGMGGTTRYWGAPVGRVPAARVVLVDPLGFGESPKPWCRYTIDAHLAALTDTLTDEGPLLLVGHSLGAILALAWAEQHVERVTGLVLLGLPCLGSRAQARAQWRQLHSPYAWAASHYLIAVASCLVTRRVLGRMLPRLMPDLPRIVAEDLVRHTWLSSTSTLWNVVFGYDVARTVRALPARLPTACVHGSLDTTAPLTTLEPLARQRPDWRWIVLPAVDHHPWLRAPCACLAAIAAVRAQRGGNCTAVLTAPPAAPSC